MKIQKYVFGVATCFVLIAFITHARNTPLQRIPLAEAKEPFDTSTITGKVTKLRGTVATVRVERILDYSPYHEVMRPAFKAGDTFTITNNAFSLNDVRSFVIDRYR